MVYLLCFKEKYKHAKHYIGYVSKNSDLDRRMERHRKCQGARLIAVITKAGIGFDVARTWPDASRDFERKLKNRKNAKMLCPICSAKPTVMKPVLVMDIETTVPTVFVKPVEDSYKVEHREYVPPHIKEAADRIFSELMANDPATVIQRNEEFKELEQPKVGAWKGLWLRFKRLFIGG